MSVYDTINLVRKRPGMFLGRNSITALSHYLDGYKAAEREYGICWKGELFPLPFRYMHEYAKYRLNESGNMGWCRLILDSCDGAEDIALQKFFEYYDEFLQIRMKRYWKVVLSEQNIAWNNQMKSCYRYTNPGKIDEGKEPIYYNPLAVYVIELNISVYLLIVEAETDIHPVPFFFPSFESAKGNKPIAGEEFYFGAIDSWEEFVDENISFDKKIIM